MSDLGLLAQAASAQTLDLSLKWWEVGIAACLIGINAILSWRLRLHGVRFVEQCARLGILR